MPRFFFLPLCVWNEIAIPNVVSLLRLQHHARIGRQVYRKHGEKGFYLIISGNPLNRSIDTARMKINEKNWWLLKPVDGAVGKGWPLLGTVLLWSVFVVCVCLATLNQYEFITHGRTPRDHRVAVVRQ